MPGKRYMLWAQIVKNGKRIETKTVYTNSEDVANVIWKEMKELLECFQLAEEIVPK